MYLSRLEIQGFKSFAQRVGLNFDSGISAIVGPNGCGKTNIVDAIRWVLGEQRYSALRSDKMEDVIFNGTKGRKPLGMAEAMLVIENTKGILPSEYSQVTIGRRVYRSGESEYLLNKVPCRLKDILDLFMDTGMGSDAYSVIELKMVETILSDTTDERRRLFEEAAGVTKYKHRRKAAYRKLEGVQADLLRVNDIVTEVQKTVNALERQARRAGQFNEMKVRLRAAEIDLMEREYSQVHARTVPLEERLASLTADHSRHSIDLGEDETQLERLRTAVLEADRRLAEAQRDATLEREKIHQVDQKTLVAAERIRALRANIDRLQQEQADLHATRLSIEGSRGEVEAKIVGLLTREASVQETLHVKQEDLRVFGERLEAKKEALRALNEGMIDLVRRIAEVSAEQERRKSQSANLRGRAQHAEDENRGYAEEILRLEQTVNELSAEDRRLRRLFAEGEMRTYEAEAKRGSLREQIEGLRRREVEVRGSMERTRARIDFLKGLIESREGLSEGVRFLSGHATWRSGQTPTVADAVSTDDRFRAAIEAALGESAGLLVVQTKAEAEEGIALLKQEGKGKATFVVMDRVPVIYSRVSLPRVEGVLGWAIDLVSCRGELLPLVRLLLDRVLIVDGPATASAVAERMSGLRCVTTDGEIVSGVGVQRGGSRRLDEGGSIGKQQQLEELARSLAADEESLRAIGRDRDLLQGEHDAVDLKGLTDAVKEIEKEMTGVEMRIAQLEFEKKRAADSVARNTEAVAALSAEADELDAESAAAEPERARQAEERGDIDRSLGAGTQELQGLEEEWTIRSAAVSDLGIELVNARNALANARAESERSGKTLQESTASLERIAREIELGEREIGATTAGIAEFEEAARELRKELDRREEAQVLAETEAVRLRNDAHGRELRIRDQRRTQEDSLRNSHELELKVHDLKAKADHLRQRAREEFEIDLELKTYPDDEFVDFASLRDEIQSMRDRMKTLGNINFAAFEEYTEEKKRFEFLTTQRQDLIEAEKALLATIEEINATAQKKFLDTFALIRTNFIETFKSLFDPGDECDLRLEEGVDPLEAGIDIVAKPRGKRPTSIDLLSGGEKTLTAIALLFAIYLVKPSPFCILDEVDAPLDDANIDRYTRILRKFSNNTQFIVVTHNKRTMEAANALYGVTMEEEGVSKLVTVRFNQDAQVASAAVASA
jgi:chromosome segregation protein